MAVVLGSRSTQTDAEGAMDRIKALGLDEGDCSIVVRRGTVDPPPDKTSRPTPRWTSPLRGRRGGPCWADSCWARWGPSSGVCWPEGLAGPRPHGVSKKRPRPTSTACTREESSSRCASNR